MILAKCGPNEAIVVSGLGYSSPKVIRGGSTFICPLVHKVQRIDLSLIHLNLVIDVIDKDAMPLTIQSSVCLRIGDSVDVLNRFLENFLSSTREEIKNSVMLTLECYHHSIMAKISLEELKVTKLFTDAFKSRASKDLSRLGFTICSIVILKWTDNIGYIDALIKKKLAETRCRLRMVEAEEKMRAEIGTILLKQEQMEKQNSCLADINQLISRFNKYSLKNQICLAEKSAESDAAFAIRHAQIKRDLVETKMDTAIYEKSKQIELQEYDTKRAKLNILNQIELPCEVMKYLMATNSQAKSTASIINSYADVQAGVIKFNSFKEVIMKETESCLSRKNTETLMEAKPRSSKKSQPKSQIPQLVTVKHHPEAAMWG